MQLALVNRRKVPSRGIRELMDLAPRPSQRPGPAGEPGQLSSVRRAGGGAGCSPNTSQRQRGAGKRPDRGGRPAPALQTTWVSNPRSTPPRPLSLKQAPLETESSVGAPVDRSLPRCPPDPKKKEEKTRGPADLQGADAPGLRRQGPSTSSIPAHQGGLARRNRGNRTQIKFQEVQVASVQVGFLRCQKVLCAMCYVLCACTHLYPLLSRRAACCR